MFGRARLCDLQLIRILFLGRFFLSGKTIHETTRTESSLRVTIPGSQVRQTFLELDVRVF